MPGTREANKRTGDPSLELWALPSTRQAQDQLLYDEAVAGPFAAQVAVGYPTLTVTEVAKPRGSWTELGFSAELL